VPNVRHDTDGDSDTHKQEVQHELQGDCGASCLGQLAVAVSVYHHVLVAAAIDAFILLKLSLLLDLVIFALPLEFDLSHD